MVAAAIIGGAVVGAAGSAYAGSQAAGAQRDAANAANATQMGQYNQTRADQAPWRAAGGQAVNALSQWYGLGGINTPPSTPATPGYSGGFIPGPNGQMIPRIQPQQSAAPASQPAAPDYNQILSNLPGYQFQLQQGQEATERNLSARGLLDSGAAQKALTQYGQGVASNYADKYVNGLQSLAGLGQTSVQATGAAGANAANQIGSNQIYSGNAAASGYAATGNAINSGLQGIVGAYGYAHNPYGGSAQDVGSNPGIYQPAGGGGYQYNIPQSLQMGLN